MKRLCPLLLIFLLMFFLSGCKPAIMTTKPSNSYYTECIKGLISKGEDIHIKVLCMNYYKAKILSAQEKEFIYIFTSLLHEDSFIDKPVDLPSKVQYKIFIEDKDSKYIINVYSSQYISIHPWDGKYEEDFLDVSSIYDSFNTYGLCKYFISTLEKDNLLYKLKDSTP